MSEAVESAREGALEQGQAQVYEAMLDARFGPIPQSADVARRLADLPRARAVRTVLAAAPLEEIVAQLERG